MQIFNKTAKNATMFIYLLPHKTEKDNTALVCCCCFQQRPMRDSWEFDFNKEKNQRNSWVDQSLWRHEYFGSNSSPRSNLNRPLCTAELFTNGNWKSPIDRNAENVFFQRWAQSFFKCLKFLVESILQLFRYVQKKV